MNALDVAFCALAGALVLFGLLRGIVRIVVSGVSLVAAFLGANVWHEALAARWEIPRIGAWAALFAGVVLAGALVGWLLSRLLRAAALGWADRLAGAALGAATAVVAAAALTLPLAAYGGPGASLLRTSRLAPYVTAVSDWINIAAPDGLAHRYERASRSLKQAWRDRG